MARGGSWLRERERTALDETPPVSMDHRPRGVPLYEPACVPVSGFPSLSPLSSSPDNVFPFDFESSSVRYEDRGQRNFQISSRIREFQETSGRKNNSLVLSHHEKVSRVFGFSPSSERMRI